MDVSRFTLSARRSIEGIGKMTACLFLGIIIGFVITSIIVLGLANLRRLQYGSRETWDRFIPPEPASRRR